MFTVIAGTASIYSAWFQNKPTRVLMPEALQQSRLEVYKIVGVPATSDKRTGFFFNVFYVNRGTISVSVMAHRSIIVYSPTLLDKNEQEEYERLADSVAAPPRTPVSEIQPGTAGVPPEHYFSTPEKDDEIADLGDKAKAVLANQQRMYLFVSMKYFDSALHTNEVRVTEFCGWFMGTFDMWHNCGSGRTYVATTS